MKAYRTRNISKNRQHSIAQDLLPERLIRELASRLQWEKKDT